MPTLWDNPRPAGTYGISDLDWYTAKMNELPGASTLRSLLYDPASNAIKSIRQAFRDPSLYNITDAAVSSYEGLPGFDDVTRNIAMGAGTIATKDLVKFFASTNRKLNKGNKFWTDLMNQYNLWNNSNEVRSVGITAFPENFKQFLDETRPARGIKANFLDPYYVPGVEEITPAPAPYDIHAPWRDNFEEYINNLDISTPFAGRDIPSYRVDQGIFGEGLKPGDTIHRGVETGTFGLGNKAPREGGPHHSTDKLTADIFAARQADRALVDDPGGEVVSSIWEGTGRGYPLQDIGFFKLSRIIDELEVDNILPFRTLEQLKDLKKRYADIYDKIDDVYHSQLDNAASEEFGKIMDDAGFDHLLYENTHENPGNVSVVPLKPYKFKPSASEYQPSKDMIRYMNSLKEDIEAGDLSLEDYYRNMTKELVYGLNPFPVTGSDTYGVVTSDTASYSEKMLKYLLGKYYK